MDASRGELLRPEPLTPTSRERHNTATLKLECFIPEVAFAL